ncbi:MAG: hypothetical protein U9R32_09150 [Bacteroidota bacterium]|nr:hypothetical protein [Bacteroidota bacterium]
MLALTLEQNIAETQINSVAQHWIENSTLLNWFKHGFHAEKSEGFSDELASIYLLQGASVVGHAGAQYIKEDRVVFNPIREFAKIIEEKFDIPQAYGRALLLPYFVKMFQKENGRCYAKIAWSLGLAGQNDEEIIETYLGVIEKNNSRLGIKTSLKETGVSEGDFIALKGYILLKMADATNGRLTKSYRNQLNHFISKVYYGN